jgi:hypothetical protein
MAGYTVGRMNNVFVNHRRYYFRCLVASGRPEANSDAALKQSNEWWYKKYGRPYIEVYYRFLLGPRLFTLVSPVFAARRIAGGIKRSLRIN